MDSLNIIFTYLLKLFTKINNNYKYQLLNEKQRIVIKFYKIKSMIHKIVNETY